MERQATHSTVAGAQRATAAGVGAIALWCSSGVFYAAGGRAVGSMPYLAMTAAVGVVTIVVLEAARGRSIRELFRLPVKVMVAGFFGVAIYSILLVGALGLARERDLGGVLLLNYLWPIWIVLLGIALLDVKVKTSLVMAGAGLGFVGVAVAQGADAMTHPPANFLPHAMTLAASFMWALYTVMLRRWKIPAERGGSTFQFAVCAIMSAVIASVMGMWRGHAGLTVGAALLVLCGGIGPVGLAYYWWEIGVKRGSMHLIAALAYFIPIVSAALMALVYRQALRPGLLPGAALIALGAYLAHRGTQGGENA